MTKKKLFLLLSVTLTAALLIWSGIFKDYNDVAKLKSSGSAQISEIGQNGITRQNVVNERTALKERTFATKKDTLAEQTTAMEQTAGAEQNIADTVGKFLPGDLVYAETLATIDSNMASLIAEVEAATRTNPHSTLQAHPGAFIENSDNYQNILRLGLKAIKPLYDKLYDSRDAGLYEYILAMAIEDITGEEFIYNVDYGWKNALEFRMAFEEKVNNVRFNVEKIINDKEIDASTKLRKLQEQGVFAVSDLLKEYEKNDSGISKQLIIAAVQEITARYDDVGISDRSVQSSRNLPANDIMSAAPLFDSLVALNGRAYS